MEDLAPDKDIQVTRQLSVSYEKSSAAEELSIEAPFFPTALTGNNSSRTDSQNNAISATNYMGPMFTEKSQKD